MRTLTTNKRKKSISRAGIATMLLACASFATAQTPQLHTLYTFKGKPNGAGPVGVIVAGGVLYGTTEYGSPSSSGTVFSMAIPKTGGGPPTEQVLYDIPSTVPDNDFLSPVVVGPGGVLYGTTSDSAPQGGSVYSLTPPASPGGAWTSNVLIAFQANGLAPWQPEASVAVGSGGTLYGTTIQGGANDSGALFSLTPPASQGGAWTESVLFSFPSNQEFPAGLIVGPGGVLYGTTDAFSGDGTFSGTVFSLTPPTAAGGAWTETTLYTFAGGSDGSNANPNGTLALGSGGVLYGTTAEGGSAGNGTVFSLAPPASAGGTWTKTTLYNFLGVSDGANPYSGVVIGKNGILYGTTFGGTTGLGTVFSLAPPASPGGAWVETVLHNFLGGVDGGYPDNVVLGKAGLLYGATSGETGSGGTLFELAP